MRFEMIGRLCTMKQHRSAGDVVAVKRPLRTAQHFHRRDIEQIGQRAGIHGHIKPVAEDADGGVDRWNGRVHADAANGDVGDAAGGTEVGDIDGRHGAGQIGEIDGVAAGEIAVIQYVDGDRGVLACIAPEFCSGDQHFFCGGFYAHKGEQRNQDGMARFEYHHGRLLTVRFCKGD